MALLDRHVKKLAEEARCVPAAPAPAIYIELGGGCTAFTPYSSCSLGRHGRRDCLPLKGGGGLTTDPVF